MCVARFRKQVWRTDSAIALQFEHLMECLHWHYKPTTESERR
jgi:hypothetical protein